jgi:hypothetical protein
VAETRCPICFGVLESREVAPCYECGHDPNELDHLAGGRHTFCEMRAFGVDIVLCDFCRVDFSSYDPTCFSRVRGTRPERELVFVRDVLNPQQTRDKFCPGCGKRLAFLRFLARVRETATV